jgi:hypothetical protein
MSWNYLKIVVLKYGGTKSERIMVRIQNSHAVNMEYIKSSNTFMLSILAVDVFYISMLIIFLKIGDKNDWSIWCRCI